MRVIEIFSGSVVQNELVPFLRLCMIIGVMQKYEMVVLFVVQKFHD